MVECKYFAWDAKLPLDMERHGNYTIRGGSSFFSKYLRNCLTLSYGKCIMFDQ